MHKYTELKVWSKAMEFAVRIYEVTAGFPKEEKFGLVSQLRRSAISVASNISEGAGRSTNRQFQYFLEYAMGSINECQTQIDISHRVGFLTEAEKLELCGEAMQIYKMLIALHRSMSDQAQKNNE
jgi:four helix bundle protein